MNLPVSGEPSIPSFYESWGKDVSSNLAGVYPFFDESAPDKFCLDISEIIENRRMAGKEVALDYAGVVTKACFPFLLRDRTLIEGVKRAPWMSEYVGNDNWRAHKLPLHRAIIPNKESFAAELKAALLEEATSYLGNSERVGILLSGGMDSRVVAAIVRQLQERFGTPKHVVALTWGDENSRDVVYSQRIAERFGWEFRHFPITVDTLKENLDIAGRYGAEVSPIHLHAIPEISSQLDLDVILAGSYGDSIGRAEYSGRKITELKEINVRHLNKFGLIRESLLRDVLPVIRNDASYFSACLSGKNNDIRKKEIQHQMHYLRRMLQCTMMNLSRNARFYQMFSCRHVVSLMWSLDPSWRTDIWYEILLKELPGNLLSIPWARTGNRYNQEKGDGDALSKQYHKYGRWLRSDLKSLVHERVSSDTIRDIGIFNPSALVKFLKAWQRATTDGPNSLDEIASWIVSLHSFISFYHIGGSNCYDVKVPRDRINALSGSVYMNLYVRLREVARK